MTTKHFRHFSSRSEQDLVEDLIEEAIEIFGMEVWYIPRKVTFQDNVLVDAKNSTFYTAYPLTVYLRNTQGFGGQGDFLSKFGLEIRDQVTLTVARRNFKKNVVDVDPLFQFDNSYEGKGVIRPREGDLIYLPLNQKIFQIRFVEHESPFYQMGSLQSFDLVCELFEYNNETFGTGIPEIDAIFTALNTNAMTGGFHNMLLDAQGNPLQSEDGVTLVTGNEPSDPVGSGENEDFQVEAEKVLDFDEQDPYSEGEKY